MAALNEYIPYCRIKRIAPVMALNKDESILDVAKRTGCDYLINGGSFVSWTKLDSGLKLDGEHLMPRNTHGLGIRADGKLEWSYGGKWTPSWMGYYRVGATGGEVYGKHLTDYRQRTGIGYTEDGIVLAATTVGMPTDAFARKYFADCTAWINLDGGTSTQWDAPSSRHTTSRNVPWYVCVWLKPEYKTTGDDGMMTNLPLNGTITMTAEFGKVNTKLWAAGHKGIDLVSADKTVYSPCDGEVRVVAFDAKGWGRYVTIGDAAGYIHILAHLAEGSVKVKKGDKVIRTSKIGTMGTTGNSTGVHLHYQINRQDNTAVDPSFWTHLPNKCGTYNASDYAVDAAGKLIVTAPTQDNSTAQIVDNTPDAWAADAVAMAVKAGVLVGDDKGDLKLHSPVTRQELAVMLARAGVI